MLARPGGGRLLHGIVLDPDGAPVSGARVSAGDEIVTSSADGTFELRWHGGIRAPDRKGEFEVEPLPDAQLVALKSGFGPAKKLST